MHFKNLIIYIFILSPVSALAEFKCSDQSYSLTLSESRPGVPPKIKITPSIIRGGGTGVGTYRYKRTYPLWSDRSKDKNDYQQPGAFTGFVSIEGIGLQKIELLCTDTSGKNPDKNTYVSISNTISWESKKGDFQTSLKEGDYVEQYPAGYKNQYVYRNGKLVPFNIRDRQDGLTTPISFIRAPIQVITPIAVVARPTKNHSVSIPRKPTSTNEVRPLTKLACSLEKKATIKLRYQETARVLNLLYKQKRSDLGCK
jgi:hypothetical protein